MRSSGPSPRPTSITVHFADLSDPRVERTRLHPLVNVLTIALLGVICGAEGWDDLAEFGHAKADWLETFLDLSHGTPSADTFRRVFCALRPDEFGRCMRSWVQSLAEPLAGQVVAFDGKSLRGAMARTFGRSALHLVHAWAVGQRLLLGIEAVPGAPEEGEAIRRLLTILDIAGAVVTVDAGNASQANAAAVVEHEADYLFAIKGNLAAMHTALVSFFDHAEATDFAGVAVSHQRDIERGHGRDEVREVWAVPAKAIPTAGRDWPSLRSFVKVDRTRVLPDATVTRETHYYASSLRPQAKRLGEVVRTHWGVENGLHWGLDAQLREDDSAIHNTNGAFAFAVLRRIALMLLKRDETTKVGIRARQKKAGWSHAYLSHLLTRGLPDSEGN